MKDLLIEIGTEDIPSSKCKDILDQLEKIVPRVFLEYRIPYKSIDYFLTLRRIVVKVNGANEYQEREIIEKKGPPVAVAFDSSGNPTKELLGFLKTHNSTIDNIQIKKIQDKEYVFLITEKECCNIREIIGKMTIEIIKQIKFDKPMYWITKEFTFIRPIRWLLIILDNEPVEIIYLQTSSKIYKSSNYTFGHRIFYPKKIRIKAVSTYIEQLREALVIINHKERENLIKDSISRIELETNLKAKLDQDLLEKLVFMYEYPIAVLSEFDEQYLDLPEELINTVCVNQQKFVPLFNQNDSISNKFIAFKEGEVIDYETNKYNYKKVVEARLADALHLLKEDRKIMLASRVSKLKDILFYDQLGTLYDKTIRIKALSEYICEKLEIDEKITEFTIRAATLSKADRTTNIVFEYPNLQGIIGKYLALEQGENEAVANAIFEHYLPLTPEDDRYPSRYEGIILAIADRIDTLVSFLSIGQNIKGSYDILSLRRTFSTLINILIKLKLSIDLEDLIKRAYEILHDKKYGIILKNTSSYNIVVREMKEFFFKRIEEIYKGQSISYDKIRAVLHIFWKNLPLAEEILLFLHSLPLEKLKNTVLLSKRLKNIVFNDYLKNNSIDEDLFPYLFEDFDSIDIIEFPTDIDRVKINTGLLKEKIEIEVVKFLEENSDYQIKGDLNSSFDKILQLSSLIEEYFNKVFVLTEDKHVRLNRVLTLYKAFLFTTYFADFSKIQVS